MPYICPWIHPPFFYCYIPELLYHINVTDGTVHNQYVSRSLEAALIISHIRNSGGPHHRTSNFCCCRLVKEIHNHHCAAYLFTTAPCFPRSTEMEQRKQNLDHLGNCWFTTGQNGLHVQKPVRWPKPAARWLSYLDILLQQQIRTQRSLR
jgi:hypothetical protein